MYASAPTSLMLAPSEPHLDVAKLGPGFTRLLALTPGLDDAALDELLHEWVIAPSPRPPYSLIEDKGMLSEMAAHEMPAPVGLVRERRSLMGI